LLTEQEAQKIMEEARALLTGHFKLSSGRHSERYLQCAQALQHPDKARRLGQALAEKCKAAVGGKIDAVASPAVGGLVIGQEVAAGLDVRHVFSERGADGKMSFRRGFKVAPGENILVVDDVLTTGLSFREVSALVEAEGGRVAGLAAVAERGAGDKGFTAPRVALLRLDFKDYDPNDCPLCKKGLPLEKPGSRPAVKA